MKLTAEHMRNTHGILLRRCQQVAMTIYMEEAAELDFSPTQFSALAFIQIEPGIHQNALGKKIALDRSSVTKCVEILENRHFIRREVDRKDKRARLLFITPEGEATLEQASAAAMRAKTRIEERMGKDRFSNFIKDLHAFSAVLDEME